ncbi:MAG: hypothetical protein ACFB0G_01480 [Leptolyngbyaceae cyanobacterium]
MNLEFEQFKGEMRDLCEIKNWRILSDDALRSLYDQFPQDTATKATVIDLKDFQQAVADLMQSEYRGDAGQILKAYRANRLHRVREETESRPMPQAATHHGRPSEEFVRVCRLMRAMREGSLPKFRQRCNHRPHGRPACEGVATRSGVGDGYAACRCYAEWNDRPLSEDDWRMGRETAPAAAISQYAGVAQADPKEGDVVWVA